MNVLEQYEAIIENMNETFIVIMNGDWDANERPLAGGRATFGSRTGISNCTTTWSDKADYKTFNDTLERTLDGEQVNERCELPLQLPTGEYILECLFSPFTSAGEHGQQSSPVMYGTESTRTGTRAQAVTARALFYGRPMALLSRRERRELSTRTPLRSRSSATKSCAG